MPISLNISKDIVANSVSIIQGNRTIDLVETIDAVQGFAPSTLNSLEKLAKAMNDDPNFFTELSNAISAKQKTLSNGALITGSQSLLNTTTSKLKNIVGKNLSLTADDENLTITAVDAYDKLNIDGKFNNKQDAFIIAPTLPAGTSRLFDISSKKFRAINVSAPLSISATSDDYLTIACDSYNKKEVTDKFTDLIGNAPVLLDTLQEIATIIGNPSNITTNFIATIATKANETRSLLNQL